MSKRGNVIAVNGNLILGLRAACHQRRYGRYVYGLLRVCEGTLHQISDAYDIRLFDGDAISQPSMYGSKAAIRPPARPITVSSRKAELYWGWSRRALLAAPGQERKYGASDSRTMTVPCQAFPLRLAIHNEAEIPLVQNNLEGDFTPRETIHVGAIEGRFVFSRSAQAMAARTVRCS